MSEGTAYDVLAVGAGPTGLALAAQLQAFGTSFRIIDRAPDRAHESRALAIQPRTLEVLAGLGVADAMVDRGNPAVRVQLHARGRTVQVPLFDTGLDDTGYPFLLFLSQAETEVILVEHLADHHVHVERGVTLTDLEQRRTHVACSLLHHDGRIELVEARYVVGCDGAHSAVRDRAGIDFTGGAYEQTFVLADLDIDGLDPAAAHVYLADAGMLFFFPLTHPADWRLLGRPVAEGSAASPRGDGPSRTELETLVGAYAGDALLLHAPVWTSYFRLQHRHASAYRSERVFVAGDAAHVHSPAGAQGMNTGIQDAWNLGWKLALVSDGIAAPQLLDTYDIERRPVGRAVVRFTDRAFTIATSNSLLPRLIRTRAAPVLAQLASHLPRGRARALRTLGQLAIDYRDSPAVGEGRPRLRRGPRAGDRLPDARVRVDATTTTLHRALAAPRLHLLLTGPTARATDDQRLLSERCGRLVEVHRLTPTPMPGALHDISGEAHLRLGLDLGDKAHHLVRPDGHIAYRAAGSDLTGLGTYLAHWFPGSSPAQDR